MSITRGQLKTAFENGADSVHGSSISDSDPLTDQQVKDILDAATDNLKTVDPDKCRPKGVKY